MVGPGCRRSMYRWFARRGLGERRTYVSIVIFTLVATVAQKWLQMVGWQEPWPLRLLYILLGYGTVVGPAVLVIVYIKRLYADEKQPTSFFGKFAKGFAVGHPEYQLLDGSSGTSTRPSRPDLGGHRRFVNDCLSIAWHFLGIQATLVVMGWFQERIMTQGYARVDDPTKTDRFGDAQFLVFCNRIVALAICGVVMLFNWNRQPPHVPPYYAHAYTSFTNTMSSWCQYEALKYVSFPIQTICKTSKVVATMLMGRLVRGTRYSFFEYICGVGIALGAALFLLGSHSDFKMDNGTTVSGIVLMAGYLAFDAFTLNWQKVLFETRPKVSKNQMMLGVNIFSAILCAVSLAEQGSFVVNFGFAWTHVNISQDIFILALSGSIGQLFIYSTIDRFGPIPFAVMMTIRQMVSILVSSISYHHPLTLWTIVGFFTVFFAVFADIYRRYFEKTSASRRTAPAPTSSPQTS